MTSLVRRCYVPTPFWAMDPTAWQQTINTLAREDRAILAFYPFKWALAHPGDSRAAVEFLQNIGVDIFDIRDPNHKSLRPKYHTAARTTATEGRPKPNMTRIWSATR